MATVNNDVTVTDLMNRVRYRRPYGKVVAKFFEVGSLKATAKALGMSTSETWRHIRFGMPALLDEVNKTMNVG